MSFVLLHIVRGISNEGDIKFLERLKSILPILKCKLNG